MGDGVREKGGLMETLLLRRWRPVCDDEPVRLSSCRRGCSGSAEWGVAAAAAATTAAAAAVVDWLLVEKVDPKRNGLFSGGELLAADGSG
jgi:hypothetical protein